MTAITNHGDTETTEGAESQSTNPKKLRASSVASVSLWLAVTRAHS